MNEKTRHNQAERKERERELDRHDPLRTARVRVERKVCVGGGGAEKKKKKKKSRLFSEKERERERERERGLHSSPSCKRKRLAS